MALETVDPSNPGIFEWLILAGAVITALTIIWKKAVMPIAKGVRTIHKTYEQVMEYDARLKHVETRSDQLVNNSGSSLRDAVDRIELAQEATNIALTRHIKWGEGELLKVWQNLASRDAVRAAAKTAEMLDRKGSNSD